MNQSPPQYVAPPPDPALAILQQQNEQQQTAAIQDRTSAQTARLMQTYGTRLAMTGQQTTPLIASSFGSASEARGTRLVINPATGAI